MWDEYIEKPKKYRSPKERKTKSADQAKNALMALCAKAEKSSGDAKRLMMQWGVPKEDQEGVLEKLLKDRFIDDERYAAAFVREKRRLNGWGKYKIRMQLALKGVAKEIIDSELEGLEDEAIKEEMQEKLVEMIKRKARTTKHKSIYELRDKLIRFGTARGHDYSSVANATNSVVEQMGQGEINGNDEEEDIF